ncbi:class I SAM-dependent methyltransferase [Actinoalloteichus sp. GBA129-24]|uniref:class I SAM-dependent methyltransferase n=1 Tax=Actinoalloteichus sp. GBA129-24 TaxID=1612551 RepID=UPI0009504565|nr:class I SAM-dependent methyltransferase [Actinoalloteichus sp. GBA129-24]APU21285.1 Methyltransferase domain [Actinoalloteichus sp. GBA129-24]
MTTPSLSPHSWPLSVIPRTAQEVWAACYPDFVAMVNQTNVMPGAFTTLNTWALQSRMDHNSTILDVACTTGFSSRELARLTGCRATGFDLSADAVALARYNHHSTDPSLDLEYVQADGTTYASSRRFSHIVVGAALGFFLDPAGMATRLTGQLDDGGYLLASPFWSAAPLSPEVAVIRREVFGISSPMETRAEALAMFAGLDLLYQADHLLIPESDADIEHYCVSTIDRACSQSGVEDSSVRAAMLARLRSIKHATNRLREHQRYSVLVLRYDASTCPRRFVELF